MDVIDVSIYDSNIKLHYAILRERRDSHINQGHELTHVQHGCVLSLERQPAANSSWLKLASPMYA
jgi:hypothetical protein